MCEGKHEYSHAFTSKWTPSRSSRLFISVGEVRVRPVRYKSLLIAMKDFISTYDNSWLVFT